MQHDDDFDLIDPSFTRGSLAQAEQELIAEQFGAHVGRVLGQVNDGKEATVYACEGCGPSQGSILAAKVYRARRFRAFRGERTYSQHRVIRDRRMAKAVARRTAVGNTAGHFLWVQHEWQTLNLLFEAGVSVPQPIAHCAVAILMEFIGDELRAAPRLIDTDLRGAALSGVWQCILVDVERMLDAGVVHGDLSPYNVLWHAGRPRIIDLPQAIELATPDARRFFERDVANLARYFVKRGMEISPLETADRLWGW